MGVESLSCEREGDSPGVRLMPPAVFACCLVCGGILEWFFPQNLSFLNHPLCMGAGVFVGGGGFFFMWAAHEKFKRAGTNVPTHLPATVFVVQGAYRYSRNPMYLGGVAFFMGLGLAAASPWLITAGLPLISYLNYYVIPREEAYMKRAFGKDYQAYCSETRRWL